MKGIITMSMVAGRLTVEKLDQTRLLTMTFTVEMVGISIQIGNCILSSIKVAYERVLEVSDSKSEAECEHWQAGQIV